MDENSAGLTIVGNVAGDVSGAPLYTHCGANYTIQGNLFFGSHAVDSKTFDPATFAACNTGGVPPQFENESECVVFRLKRPRLYALEPPLQLP